MTTRIAFLLALGACTSNDMSGSATLTATWDVKNVDGSAAACIAGYQTMKITVDGFEDNGVEDANPHSSLFDCAAGTAEVPLTGGFGHYNVIWEETTTSGDTTIMQDLVSATAQPAMKVEVHGGHATAHTTFYPQGGWAWIEWDLFGMQASADLASCADAGVDRVVATFTDDAGKVVTASSACDAVPADLGLTGIHTVGGLVQPLAAGQYTLALTAYAGSQVVGTSRPGESTSIGDKNAIGLSGDPVEIDLTNR